MGQAVRHRSFLLESTPDAVVRCPGLKVLPHHASEASCLYSACLRRLPQLSASTSGAESLRVLTSFDSPESDLGWRVVNDNVMGGRSVGGFEVADGVLVFSGATNTDGGGFSSIRTEARDLDLGAWQGVRLRVRGDGRTYTFRLSTDNADLSPIGPDFRPGRMSGRKCSCPSLHSGRTGVDANSMRGQYLRQTFESWVS